MDLLKTILIYMSMVFVSSVQTAPEAALLPLEPTAAPIHIVQAATATPVPTHSPTPVPTPAITPNSEYKTLQVGDRGDKVKTLQRRLAELGYYTGNVDGAYGNQTRRAVERFQYYHGLSADGIAGRRTQTVLYESTDIVFAPVDVTPTPPPTLPSEGIGSALETAGSPTAARTLSPGATTPAPTYVPPSASTAPPIQASGAALTDTPAADISTQAATQAFTQAPALTPEPVTAESPEPDQTQDATDTPAAGEGTPATEAPVTETPATDTPAMDTPAPQGEATPEPGEQLPVAMEGYSLWLQGKEQPVMNPGTLDNPEIEPMALPPLVDAQGQALVPLLEILRDGGSWVVPQESEGHWDYAFALGENVYQLSFDIDQEGNPTGLAIFKNNEPQLMERRVAVLKDGILYLYLADVEKITGIAFLLEEEAQVYTVTMPGEQ